MPRSLPGLRNTSKALHLSSVGSVSWVLRPWATFSNKITTRERHSVVSGRVGRSAKGGLLRGLEYLQARWPGPRQSS